MKDFYTHPLNEILKIFETDTKKGLSSEEVDRNRHKFGANTIEEIKPATALELIIDGVREPMMIVLLAIGGLSLLFGKVAEAVVMVFVVAAYIGVEFVNKYRTDQTMTQLRRLTAATAKVIRDGQHQDIATNQVVCGDILILTEGTRVSADARLLESSGLTVDEASFTGESFAVEKDARTTLSLDTSLAERRNMIFAGTIIQNGEGTAIVTAVGKESEFGKIAGDVGRVTKEKTVLQTAMKKLAKILLFFAIGVSALIPAVGFLQGLSFEEMVVTWLALTFLMIPGQPPVIITMALALASFKLAKINLVVKRLHGVESLSQVTAIVTDKTGTITENRMSVDYFVLSDGTHVSPEEMSAETQRSIFYALPRYSNDPTDTAVRAAVSSAGTEETPLHFKGFSESQPWREIIYDRSGERAVYRAGKTEEILAHTGHAHNGKIEEAITAATAQGRRVVAYACGKENDLSLLALAVLTDPIRNGVKETLTSLKDASVKTYIVTGDHPDTARALATELGLASEVIVGSKLSTMDDALLEATLRSTTAFARIEPSQKLRIVEALKRMGEVVAVIGDGINDAPALRAANVGIAMGEIGTDLAKETADLVLTDDNYTHIAEAISIARTAHDNFRKGLTYYLTAKAILLSIFLIPLALGVPFPFAAIHIILTELLMDLASSTIFVTEAAEPNVLQKGVRKLKDFLGKELVFSIAKNGVWLALGITTLYLLVYYQTGNVVLAQTTAFVTWLLGHILLALNLKQEKLSLLRQGLFSNRFATFWLVGMVVLAVAITNVSSIQQYMSSTFIPVHIWLGIIAVAFVTTWWIELSKLLRIRRSSV